MVPVKPALLAAVAVAACALAGCAEKKEKLPAEKPHSTLEGVYAPALDKFRATTKRRPVVRSRYVDWDPRGNAGEDWGATIAAAESEGMRLEVHWSPERFAGGGQEAAVSLAGIVKGRGDEVAVAAAAGLRKAKRPVFLRFAAEMNGNWHTYSGYTRDEEPRGEIGSPETYIAAWQRVRTIFRGGSAAEVNRALKELGQPPLTVRPRGRIGAPRVAFVWTPNLSSQPDVPGNAPERYYPGDAFVDWTGVDVFDTDPWPAIERLLDTHYQAHPEKPFALAEWGLRTNGDNGRFVDDMFDWLREHPRVGLIQWWDAGPSRLSENPKAAARYRERIGSPRYAPR
jgi:hypothetical protein